MSRGVRPIYLTIVDLADETERSEGAELGDEFDIDIDNSEDKPQRGGASARGARGRGGKTSVSCPFISLPSYPEFLHSHPYPHPHLTLLCQSPLAKPSTVNDRFLPSRGASDLYNYTPSPSLRNNADKQMPRSARDNKYSLGGSSRRDKQNTKESAMDIPGWNTKAGSSSGGRGGRGGSSGGRGGGRGGSSGDRGRGGKSAPSQRPGKSRRK